MLGRWQKPRIWATRDSSFRGLLSLLHLVGWPSGLRRQFQALVPSEAWVRIPVQSFLFNPSAKKTNKQTGKQSKKNRRRKQKTKRDQKKTGNLTFLGAFGEKRENQKVPRLEVAPRFSRPQRKVIAPILSRQQEGRQTGRRCLHNALSHVKSFTGVQ